MSKHLGPEWEILQKFHHALLSAISVGMIGYDFVTVQIQMETGIHGR